MMALNQRIKGTIINVIYVAWLPVGLYDARPIKLLKRININLRPPPILAQDPSMAGLRLAYLGILENIKTIMGPITAF